MNKQQLLSRVNPGKSGKQKSLKMLVFQAFVMNYNDSGGERGIRTPGPLTVNGFQDRRNRPLCHLSAAKVRVQLFTGKK